MKSHSSFTVGIEGNGVLDSHKPPILITCFDWHHRQWPCLTFMWSFHFCRTTPCKRQFFLSVWTESKWPNRYSWLVAEKACLE